MEGWLMADPISTAIAAFAFNAGATITTAIVIGDIAASIIIAAGTQLATSAITPKPKVGATTSQLQTKVGATTPRAIVMGRTAVAGTLLTPTPLKSGKDDRFASNFYALSHAGPSGVVESIQWGDDTVTFDANGNAIGKYNDNMWLFQKNGSWSQTAISYVGHAVLGSSTPSAWDSTKTGKGCLMVALVVRYAAKVLGGNMQTPLFVVDANAAALIDPRTGLAATTQAQRRNPAVWAYSWRLGWFQNSKRVIGMGQASSEIHTAAYAYAANVADTNSWTIGGEATTADDRYAVETIILQTCASIPVERNGLQSVVTSAVRSSVGTITSDDLRADPKWRYNTQQSSRPTAIQTRYRSETNRWQMVEGAEVTDAGWLTQDAGREKRATVEYPYAAGGSAHVGHLAALEASNAREPLIFTLQCKQQARYDGFVGDAVTVSLPEIGLSSTKMVITSRVVNPDGTVDFDLLVETDAKYSFAAGKTSAAPSFTLQPGFDIFSVPQPGAAEWASVAAQITSGATSLPIVRVTGSAADYSFASGVVFKIRLNSGGSPWLVSEDAPPAATQHEFRGLTNATSYIVGVAYRGVTGVEGPVRELAAVTTGTMVAAEAGAGVGGAPILNSVIGPNDGALASNPNLAVDPNFKLTDGGAGFSDQWSAGSSGWYRQDVFGLGSFAQNVNSGTLVLTSTWFEPVVAGSVLTLQAEFRCLGLASAAVCLVDIIWTNNSGLSGIISFSSPIGVNGASYAAGSPKKYGDWLPVYATGGFTAPIGATRAYVRVYVVGTNTDSGVRAIKLESGSVPTLFNDAATAKRVQGAIVGTDFRFPDLSVPPIGRVDNALSPLGENQVVNSDLNQGTMGFEFVNQSNMTGTGIAFQSGRNLVNTPNYFGARNVFWGLVGTSSGNFTGGSYLDGWWQLGINGPSVTNLRRYATQVTPGERVYYGVKVAVHGMTNATLVLIYYDRDGTQLSSTQTGATIGDARLGGPSGAWGLPSNFATLGAFHTVPANAVFAAMYVYGSGLSPSQSSAYIFHCDYFIAKVGADQTVAPAYNAGPVDRASDRTGENTAATIIGQGTGATANNLTGLNPTEGGKLTGIEAGADVTANATPILEGPSSVSFDVDSAGALDPAGQVPLTLQFIRKRGNTDVSTSTTWSIVSPVNITLGTITNGGVNVTAVAAGLSNFTVRSVRDGVTMDLLVNVTKNTIVVAGGSGKIAIDSTANGIASGTYSEVLSVSLVDAPTGVAEITATYDPSGASGTSTDFQLRLTRAGSMIAEGTSFNGIDGTGLITPDWFSEMAQFAGFYSAASGTATWAIEAKRTSGSGSITTATGQLVVNQQPT
jgi:hypothetical protein